MDHQHGLVTGFAIDKGVDLWFDVREDSQVILDSETFSGHVAFDIAAPTLVKQGNWGDYARGAKFALQKRFQLVRGIEGTIKGSLPVGGLSSSAAVLIAYVMAFAKANNITLAPFEVMKIASEAECWTRLALRWERRTICSCWTARAMSIGSFPRPITCRSLSWASSSADSQGA